ncbi:MAG: secretin N-terminal domain-containing protein, partial [Phycisphaerae bacterium]
MPVVVPAPGASSASAEAPNASRPDRGRDDGLAQAGRGRNTGLAASGISMNLDKGTNSVIVMAEPRMLAQIEALIRLIDVRQPQVMLEMTLVSLSDQDAM